MIARYTYSAGSAYYEIARQFGDRIALRLPTGDNVTHDELNRHSNRIARTLRSIGIDQGDVVAIFSNKSVDAIAVMLACLKIGAIYTNLDVTSPQQRIEKMLATCEPALIVMDHGVATDLQSFDRYDQIGLGDEEFQDRVNDASDQDLRLSMTIVGTDPAYIMFTSGSTGFPKGAVMTHANVLNFAEWGRATFSVVPDDVFTNVNPLYFDNSVFDFYVSLLNGASFCPIGSDLVRRSRDLVTCIDKLGCTIWFSVPSMLVYLLTMRAIESNNFLSMRCVVFGGEGFPKPKLLDLHNLIGSRTRLINVYGPTECTCICSSYEIQEEDFEDMLELAPLGNIAPNFGYHIEPLDQGDPGLGELLLYGPNVGLGYFNDETRTRTAFVPDARITTFPRVMYKTGDLVQRAENGWLHFKGRVDNQIKHMGYRIELEEIEAAFSTLEHVDEVGIVYRSSEQGAGHIIAHVGTKEELTEDDVLSDVKKIIPPYMIPRRVHFMRELPKNRNGKIDRKKLKELNP